VVSASLVCMAGAISIRVNDERLQFDSFRQSKDVFRNKILFKRRIRSFSSSGSFCCYLISALVRDAWKVVWLGCRLLLDRSRSLMFWSSAIASIISENIFVFYVLNARFCKQISSKESASLK